MRLEHYPIAKLKDQIKALFAKHLDLSEHRLFFFGSRITGKGDERSDIDIGIEGPQKLPLGILGKLKEGLENLPILYKIDLVDFKRADPGFRKIALEKTERIL